MIDRKDKIIGIVYAYDLKDEYDLVLDLGIQWIRLGICFPWEDKMYGTISKKYLECKDRFIKAHNYGIKTMPDTPGMGGYFYDEEKGCTYWHDSWPEFIGEKGTEEYYINIAATTRYICEDLGELAGNVWQCMNEIDIPTFSGDYPTEVVIGTARASAEGIVAANPDALCGINLSRYYEEGLIIADKVYAHGHKFGYIGDDQYFGSWQGKTVEAWNEVITLLYERYHLPVLANEWGYSSGGNVREHRPDASQLPEGIPDTCYVKSWFHEVDGGHTREVQTEYIRRGYEIFADHPHSLGSFLFCLKDAKACYHCGESDCPSECYWGIVDTMGNKKPAYYAVKQAIAEFYK